jgi:hypothetical protein
MSGQETSSCPRRLAALAARRSAGATLFFDNSNRSRKRFTPNPGIHSATNATRCNMKSKKNGAVHMAWALGGRTRIIPFFIVRPSPVLSALIGVHRRLFRLLFALSSPVLVARTRSARHLRAGPRLTHKLRIISMIGFVWANCHPFAPCTKPPNYA